MSKEFWDVPQLKKYVYARFGEVYESDRSYHFLLEDVSERWACGLVEHPFPIALRSLQFNWSFMKEHGVQAFYFMTTQYLDGLTGNTRHWRDAWEDEATSGVIDRVTTVECDLASKEATMHCNVCKKTITALLYLDG